MVMSTGMRGEVPFFGGEGVHGGWGRETGHRDIRVRWTCFGEEGVHGWWGGETGHTGIQLTDGSPTPTEA